MTETVFVELCDHLADHLWLQALLVAVGTCFLEDVARCGVSLLVAAGHLGWGLAFASMTVGGMAGDIGLYLTGRYATSLLFRLRWVSPSRLEWMEAYFSRHAIKTVVVSRFLPGARTLGNAAAGAVRYPLPRFLLLLFFSAVAQSLLFLQLGAFIGETVLPYLRDPRLRLAVFVLALLTLLAAHRAFVRRRKLPPPDTGGDARPAAVRET